MPDMYGKVALVIGASLPGGRTLAVALAEAGADVAVATRSNDRQEEVLVNSCANEIWAIGRKGLAATIDAADMAAVEELKRKAAAELGALDFVIEAFS